MNSQEFQTRLAERAELAGVSITGVLADRLEAYFRLLATWNAKINLTALPLDGPLPQTIDRLLIEPLVAATCVSPGAIRMLDVGSGGGSPAIPLVLARPDLQLLMVESRTRKAVFLKEATRSLGISAEVATSRVEDLATAPALHEIHDLVTMRAVRSSRELMLSLRTLIRPTGQLFLFVAADDSADPDHGPFRPAASKTLVASLNSKLTILSPA